MKKKSGKYWLDSGEKKLLYNLRNPENFKKYKKKIKNENTEKNLKKESKENEEFQVQTGTVCYECGRKFDSTEIPDDLPHRYCKNCIQAREYQMQVQCNRLPIEMRRVYEPYIRKGIIGWYDTSPEDRELHDREMKGYREGLIQISEACHDNLQTNQEYLKRTLGSGEERISLEIAKDMIVHLDWNRINFIYRQKRWNTLIDNLRKDGVVIKVTNIKEPDLEMIIPSLERSLMEKERDFFVTLQIKKSLADKP